MAVTEPGIVTAELHRLVESRDVFIRRTPRARTAVVSAGMLPRAQEDQGLSATAHTKDYVCGLEAVLPSGEIMNAGAKVVRMSRATTCVSFSSDLKGPWPLSRRSFSG